MIIPRQVIDLEHVTERFKQWIRRNGGGGGGVGGGGLADGSVTTTKLAADAVTTAKLADDSVTTAKLGDDAVTIGKIDPAVSPAVHVRVACRTNVTLDGSDTTYDGVTLATGDIILAFKQTPATGNTHSAANGLYLKTASGMERLTSDAQKMRLVHVMEGTFAGGVFELATDGSIAVGTTTLRFRRVDGRLKVFTVDDTSATYDADYGRCLYAWSNISANRTLTLGPASEDGIEVAVAIHDQSPGANQVSFVTSGSESVFGVDEITGANAVIRLVARDEDWYNI